MFSKATRDARERGKVRRASDAVVAKEIGDKKKEEIQEERKRELGEEDEKEEQEQEEYEEERRNAVLKATENSTLPKEVTSVMDAVRVNWDFMSNTQFNPVPHALSLLDSSHGLDIKKFYLMHEKLEQTMDVIVNDYHQAFNDSIQTFSAVVENISDSQKRVSDMKSELDWCKELLQSRKFDVFPLWVKSIQYKEMMHILDTIEALQKVPDRIESLITGRFFFMAVTTLMSSLSVLNSPEFQDIGALSNIRVHLVEVAETLHETLIDELNNHLYLKSPHSLDRIGVLLQDLESRDNLKTTTPFDSSANLMDLEDHKLLEDLDANPEQDSFHYMKVLVECLDIIERLPDAVEILQDRLSVEFYYTVERTIQETDQQKPRNDAPKRQSSTSNAQDLIGLSDRLEDAYILRDLLCNLFEKLETIIVGHGFVLKMINQKLENRGIAIEVYSIHEVWSVVQNEVKSLLYDYLTRTSRTSDFESAIVTMNDILKEKRSFRGMPSRGGDSKKSESTKLFKLSTAPNAALTAEYMKLKGAKEIQNISAITLNDEAISTATTGIVDKYANVVSTGHRLLISPDPYNVLIAFKPTMSFVRKIEDMVSRKKTGKFTIFLDDFILSVFLPSMEERVLEYFHEFVNGSESFVTDQNQDVAPMPLVKSVVALTVLIQAMCRTLFVMPVHQIEFIKMIEMIVVKFYEKILARYRSLMAGEQLHEDYQGVGIISAGWACEDEVVQLLLKNTYFLPGIPNAAINKVLAESETYAEMNFKKERSFDRRELIFDSRKLQAVAHMHYSIDWFIAQIGHLRVTEKSIRRIPPLLKPRSSKVMDSNTSINDGSASTESLPPLIVETEDDVQLPLNAEMTNRFDAILNYYQELSETYLFALHVEIRCHAMYYLDLAMREGCYYLENEPYEPDSYINSLNQDLIMIQETVAAALPLRKIRFLYDGLSYLIMHVLSVNLKYVKRINKFGVSKLLRNVESLQQSLTNIAAVHEKGLDRVRKYFELLNISGHEMLQYMETHPGEFTFDEYKVVLDLIFQDVLEDTSLPKKEYSDCLEGLKTFFINH
ncbi:Sec8 exocyst complex component-specific domain-containing protein [Obelidium mucronatum]|nr:Sec8 exocyst complex component-specific domain-containing protein [Obelidium mucronatum]